MSKRYKGFKGSGYSTKPKAIHINKTLLNAMTKVMTINLKKANIICKY